MHVFSYRIPGNEHWTNAGAQEVVGAAGAYLAQFLCPSRVCECQHVLGVFVVGDHTAVGRNSSPQAWKDRGCDRIAIDPLIHGSASESRSARSSSMILHEFAQLIDGPDAILVTLRLCLTPSK